MVKKQVTSNREARSSAGGDATSEIARRGFLGLAGLSTVAYFSATGGQTQTAATEETDPFGNAVTAPTLELDLDDLLELSKKQGVAPPDASVMALVQQLEETGGPQFEASFLQGKWVLPWVGGWERVWSSQADSLALALALTLTLVRHAVRALGGSSWRVPSGGVRAHAAVRAPGGAAPRRAARAARAAGTAATPAAAARALAAAAAALLPAGAALVHAAATAAAPRRTAPALRSPAAPRHAPSGWCAAPRGASPRVRRHARRQLVCLPTRSALVALPGRLGCHRRRR